MRYFYLKSDNRAIYRKIKKKFLKKKLKKIIVKLEWIFKFFKNLFQHEIFKESNISDQLLKYHDNLLTNLKQIFQKDFLRDF